MSNNILEHNGALPDIWRIHEVYGQLYYVITVDSGSNSAREGLQANTVALVEGDGYFVTKDLKLYMDERLHDIGIQYAFPRRGDDSRTVLLLCREAWMLDSVADVDQLMIDAVALVKKVTEEVNAATGTLKEYTCAAPTHEMSPGGIRIASLDHYLEDIDVIRVLEESNWILEFDFAPGRAADMYFDPDRQTYPSEAHQYGYLDVIPSLDYYLSDSDVILVLKKNNRNLEFDFAPGRDADMYFDPDRQTYPTEAHQYGYVDK